MVGVVLPTLHTREVGSRAFPGVGLRAEDIWHT